MLDNLRSLLPCPSNFLSNNLSSVPLRVEPIENAAVCWSRAPQLSKEQLRQFGVRISAVGDAEAWGDRYGGYGIGANGGSGRAGFFRGMYLKGIGPTPLIGSTTDIYHSSGGAYLEEAVREAIFGEIFSAELPWGAVQTAGIIDTLEEQIWDAVPNSDGSVPWERKVIIVREAKIRPAHFMRANHFNSPDRLAGNHDLQRVEYNLEAIISAVGWAGFEKLMRAFWFRWMDQCAYQYAARLTQGSPTPSNINLDGQLLDFGAASALPDWCAAVVVPGEMEFGFELSQISSHINEFYAQHRDRPVVNGMHWSEYCEALTSQCAAHYYQSVGCELLRLAGIRRSVIEIHLADQGNCLRLIDASKIATRRYQRKFRPSINGSADEVIWDFSRFWSDDVPVHLRPLRSCATIIVGNAQNEPILQRMRSRCTSREGLFRESFRRRLHGSLPKLHNGLPVDSAAIHRVIRSEVTAGRRDTKFEPEHDFLFGFASDNASIFSLFQRTDGSRYALDDTNVHRSNPKIRYNFKNDKIKGLIVDDLAIL